MSFNFERNLNAKTLWDIFYRFTQIPRPSKEEGKISEYIRGFAKEHNFTLESDEVGNLLVKVPGVGSSAHHDSLLIQNHIDMVTDAAPGVEINFSTDPINAYIDGDWIRAKGTTLGADNGIGCAAALALAVDCDDHPPLELLFTIDEETGLTGAQGLDGNLIKSKKVLNLDTEEWGSLYIGCAGGANFDLKKEYKFSDDERSSELNLCVRVELSSFNGGHSGVDVHRYRKNAIKALSEILKDCEFDLALHSIRAGKAHNIIPRDAKADFFINASHLKDLEAIVQKKVQAWNSYLSSEDLEFKAEVIKLENKEGSYSERDSLEVINLLTLFPHGVHSVVRQTVSESEAPLVGISNNLAQCLLHKGQLYILTSLRFFNREESFELESKMRTLAQVFGLDISKNSEYPSWEPDFKTEILEKSLKVFKDSFGEAPQVKAIHAGLECGILLDRIPLKAEAISFGPTIVDAHSPDERVHIDSVEHFWRYLKILVKEI